MNDNEIRSLWAKDFKRLKRLSLSKTQLEVLQLSKRTNGVNSMDLVSKKKITIQNASCQLSVLHKKGYLIKVQKVHPTGGKYFQYHYFDKLGVF